MRLFIEGWNGNQTGRRTLDDSVCLHVAKEEALVLDDGPAQASTELVQPVFGARVGTLGEVIVGIQFVVTPELIERAMKSVRSRLGNYVNHRSWCTAQFGREGVGDDLDLLNGVDRWTDHDQTLLELIVVHAIYEI